MWQLQVFGLCRYGVVSQSLVQLDTVQKLADMLLVMEQLTLSFRLQTPSKEGILGAAIIIVCTAALGFVEKKKHPVVAESRQGAA